MEFAIPDSLLAASERWIPSSVAGILISAVPLTMVPMARLFGVRERLGGRRLLGLVLGLLGVTALSMLATFCLIGRAGKPPAHRWRRPSPAHGAMRRVIITSMLVSCRRPDWLVL